MENQSSIKTDVITIVIMIFAIAVLFSVLKIYDLQTGMIANWSANLYNWLLQK